MMAADTDALVAAIERFLDEIEGGDIDAAMKVVAPLVHPEMEFTSAIGSEIDGRTYIGLDGLRAWFQDLIDAFEARYENRRFRVLGEAVVVGLFTNRQRGRGSDVEVTLEIGIVWELRNGQVVKAHSYASQDQALRAAEAAVA